MDASVAGIRWASSQPTKLPAGWSQAELSEIAQINPPLDRCVLNDSVEVNFVPMRAVEPEGGGLLRPETARYERVKKGCTAFLGGDVFSAKITPCMENGKTCVVPQLPGSVCYGSTEFHVFRAEAGIDSRWIAYYLLQLSFRYRAQRQMTGGVGQMRVPEAFFAAVELPVPPTAEQFRVLDTLDELLSYLDAGVAALERVRTKLKHYRAAVLKAAVEGELTTDWRAAHPHTEPATRLLARILRRRRRLWQRDQLHKFKEAGRTPPNGWMTKYKNPKLADASNLPPLPSGWLWASTDQLCSQVTDGEHIQPRYPSHGRPMLSAKNVRNGYVDFGDFDLISESDFENCLRRCAPRKNDVLVVSVRATTGRTAMVGDAEPFSIVRSVLLLCSLAHPRYLMTWYQSPWCQQYINRASGSSAQAHLYISDTKVISIPLAPEVEIERIIERAE
ncbi:MAG: restriction endonuclease subunit S [Panacagrimonas sp.]